MPRYRITLRNFEWENNATPLEVTGNLSFNDDYFSVWDENDEAILVVPAGLVLHAEKVEESKDILTEIMDRTADAFDFLKDFRKGLS